MGGVVVKEGNFRKKRRNQKNYFKRTEYDSNTGKTRKATKKTEVFLPETKRGHKGKQEQSTQNQKTSHPRRPYAPYAGGARKKEPPSATHAPERRGRGTHCRKVRSTKRGEQSVAREPS